MSLMLSAAMTLKRLRLFFIILMMAMMVSACGTETPFPTTNLPTQAVLTETASPEPAATPTVTENPPVLFLLAPADADPTLVSQVEPVVQAAASQAGILYQRVDSMLPGEVPANAAAVVVLHPAPAGDLAISASSIPFVSLGQHDIASAENLLVIEALLPDADQQAYAAGYAAAVLSQDWRAGVLSFSDTPDGAAARTAFLMGAEYFCGLCRPVYPPYYDANNNLLQYPTSIEVSSGASSEELLAAAQRLIDLQAEVVYLANGTGDPAVIQAFSDAGVWMIGSSTPPSPLPAGWAATISGDRIEILRRVLPGLLSGGPGPESLPGLSIFDVNTEYFSPGKVDLVETLIEEITAGRIQTGPVP